MGCYDLLIKHLNLPRVLFYVDRLRVRVENVRRILEGGVARGPISVSQAEHGQRAGGREF